MSIGVGTLQPKTRIIRPVWVGGLLALVVSLVFAVAITNDPVEQTISTESRYTGTAANTPTEIRYAGSSVSGTAANTPTEIRYAGPAKDGIDPKSGTAANTPTELSGGLPAPADLTYVPIVVNGEVFWRLVP